MKDTIRYGELTMLKAEMDFVASWYLRWKKKSLFYLSVYVWFQRKKGMIGAITE